MGRHIIEKRVGRQASETEHAGCHTRRSEMQACRRQVDRQTDRRTYKQADRHADRSGRDAGIKTDISGYL